MSGHGSHFMSTIKVGSKGQIVIPKEIRDMFEIKPGDNLIIMADSHKGIALQREQVLIKIAEAIFGGVGKEMYPTETDESLKEFAKAIKRTVENGDSEK